MCCVSTILSMLGSETGSQTRDIVENSYIVIEKKHIVMQKQFQHYTSPRPLTSRVTPFLFFFCGKRFLIPKLHCYCYER